VANLTVRQERAQLLGGQANPTLPTVTPSAEAQGYAVTSPSDKDIGEQQILKRMEEYKPFTVSVYSPFFWTSNAALVSRGEEDDFVVAPGITLMYQPRITKTFYAELGVVHGPSRVVPGLGLVDLRGSAPLRIRTRAIREEISENIVSP
jgi:hypothetical protein